MQVPTLFGFRHTFLRAGALSCAIALSLSGSVTASPSTPERIIPEFSWETSMSRYQMDKDKFIGQRLTFSCPKRSVGQTNEAVFGTDVYPSTTPLCTAAMHAGVISANGGVVTAQLNPGADEYKGTSRNGVTSGDLPATERSVVFVEGDNAAANTVQEKHVPHLTWDTKFTATGLANKDMVGQQFSFVCPAAPSDMTPRSVYGTDQYAFHSIVCRAAVHAGKITTEGGPVLVQLNPAVSKVVGSIRNNVQSESGPGGIRSLVFLDAR